MLQTVVKVVVIRSSSIQLFSTSLGRTIAEELATEIEGNELKGIFEKEGKARQTCVDSGS